MVCESTRLFALKNTQLLFVLKKSFPHSEMLDNNVGCLERTLWPPQLTPLLEDMELFHSSGQQLEKHKPDISQVVVLNACIHDIYDVAPLKC